MNSRTVFMLSQLFLYDSASFYPSQRTTLPALPAPSLARRANRGTPPLEVLFWKRCLTFNNAKYSEISVAERD
jgi:hypothetical protein